MKILFVGDVVGKLGCDVVYDYLPKLKQKYRPQLTILNGENAAQGGRGITESIYKSFLTHGVDVVTLGNHSFDQREIYDFIDESKKLIRPANYGESIPGKGYSIIQINQYKVAVINLEGRVFMRNLFDPFETAKEIVAECRRHTPIIFIDFHAEVTSEKQALAWYLDGQISALVGTHTHVQTNDARILPQGTAYLTDVGMTGPYDGILGMERHAVTRRFLTQLPTRFEVLESGRVQLSACLIDIDEKTGRATQIKNILINDDHPFYE